jgi:hypothetical protein
MKKKYFTVALVFAVPASATSLVLTPDAARVIGSAAPTPPPTSSTGQGVWQSAPLRDGGYARCKNPAGCHDFSSDVLIANYGTIWMYAWNGRSAPTTSSPLGRGIGAFWPQGNYQQPGIGVEGFIDEWEGVA